MKVKGINAFEQHLEKIVFGAALAGAAGILAWHFISAPEVKVGTQAVAPDQVDRLLESRADQIRSKLRGPDGLRNGADLGFLLANWGTPGADLNADGTTNGADLGALLAVFNLPCN